MEFFQHVVKREPGCGGTKLEMGITDYVGCLSRTVVSHDGDNYERVAS